MHGFSAQLLIVLSNDSTKFELGLCVKEFGTSLLNNLVQADLAVF